MINLLYLNTSSKNQDILLNALDCQLKNDQVLFAVLMPQTLCVGHIELHMSVHPSEPAFGIYRFIFCMKTVGKLIKGFFLGVRKRVIMGLFKLINASVPVKQLTICSVGTSVHPSVCMYESLVCATPPTQFCSRVSIYLVMAPDCFLLPVYIYTYSGKSCVCNSSYTIKGTMTKLLQMADLNVQLCKKQSINSRVRFQGIMYPDQFLLFTHIMENLFCAKLLALDGMILTPFGTNSVIWEALV